MYKASFDPYNMQPQSNGDPDLVYLNLSVINQGTEDDNAAVPVRFVETRDAPVLKDASKYQMSVVRFTMSGMDLPLFIPTVKTTQPDPNMTEYEMAVSYEQTWVTTDHPAGVLIRAVPAVNSMIWTPELKNQATPRAPNLNGQDVTSSRYYHAHSYQHVIDCFNVALATAWSNTYTAFQTAWAAATGDAFPYASQAAWMADAGCAPMITYDAASGLFSIRADARSFGQRVPAWAAPGGGTSPLTAPVSRLFMDTNMCTLFANFDSNTWGAGGAGPFGTGTVAGYVYEVVFPNKGWTNLQDLSTVAPAWLPADQRGLFWTVTQDFESTSGGCWSPIASIVFTTSLLPVRSEAVTPPVLYGKTNTGNQMSSVSNATLPIITDIAIDLAGDGADAYRKMIYYAPTAQYRYASLSSSKVPINSVDVALFYKLRLTGELVPVTCRNQASVDIKILFARCRE